LKTRTRSSHPKIDSCSLNQGCQIFPNIPKRIKLTKRLQTIPNGYKLYQITGKYSQNITTFYIPRPSKFYPKWDFWSENKPSGNPALNTGEGGN
jgi:hypothetical protein